MGQQSIIDGDSVPDKMATASVCGGASEETTYALWEALANRMYSKPNSYCVFSLNRPTEMAFKWSKTCWKELSREDFPNASCWKRSDAGIAATLAGQICGSCFDKVDHYDECHWDWAVKGFCTEGYVEWMKAYCPKTCCELGFDFES